MKIPVVHLLTNRAGGFQSSAFPQADDFVPSVLPDVAQASRTLLQLDRTDTDYYVHAALRILQTQADLWDVLFRNRPDNTVLSAQRPALPTTSQGQLIHTGLTPPSVLRVAAEWPVQTEIRVQLGANVAYISLGDMEWIGVGMVLSLKGDMLRIDWPPELGINGIMYRADGWDSVTEFSIWHEPVRFPCRVLFDKIRDDVRVQAVLAGAGALDAVLQTVDPVRGVALVLASLVTTHPQFTWQ